MCAGRLWPRLSGYPTTSSSTSLSMPLFCVHHWQLPSVLPDSAPQPPFKCKLCERVGSPPDSLVQPQDLEQWPAHPKSWIQWKNATLHSVNATLVLFLRPKYVPFFGIYMAFPDLCLSSPTHYTILSESSIILPSNQGFTLAVHLYTLFPLWHTLPYVELFIPEHRPGLTSFKGLSKTLTSTHPHSAHF